MLSMHWSSLCASILTVVILAMVLVRWQRGKRQINEWTMEDICLPGQPATRQVKQLAPGCLRTFSWAVPTTRLPIFSYLPGILTHPALTHTVSTVHLLPIPQGAGKAPTFPDKPISFYGRITCVYCSGRKLLHVWLSQVWRTQGQDPHLSHPFITSNSKVKEWPFTRGRSHPIKSCTSFFALSEDRWSIHRGWEESW